jgi:copper transporter 1
MSSAMPMSSSAPMSMGSMGSMVFHTSTHDPLYSTRWTPHSAPAYAGTCIFLILLAALWRGSFAFKAIVERRWLDAALKRRYVVIAGKPREAERVSQESEGKGVVLLTERGVEEEVRVVRSKARAVMPWRWSVDLPRAFMVFVISGVGYLL